MIFQYTIDKVLSGEKTQTARIWKPHYRIGNSRAPLSGLWQERGYGPFLAVWLVKFGKPRLVYHVSQYLAVQSGRGKSSIARIGINKLWKQDVREYTPDDVRREGFESLDDFLFVWREMHAEQYIALCIRFELVKVLADGVN